MNVRWLGTVMAFVYLARIAAMIASGVGWSMALFGNAIVVAGYIFLQLFLGRTRKAAAFQEIVRWGFGLYWVVKWGGSLPMFVALHLAIDAIGYCSMRLFGDKTSAEITERLFEDDAPAVASVVLTEEPTALPAAEKPAE